MRHARSEQATPQRHMLHMVAEAMLETDRVAKITRNGPGTANSCRAYVAARGAPTQVISGGRSQWRNRSHGAYRCARKAAGGGVAYTRTHFSLLPTSGTSRGSRATRAAPLRKSRRLAEFATKRSGLNKKKRSERRLARARAISSKKRRARVAELGYLGAPVAWMRRVKAPTSSVRRYERREESRVTSKGTRSSVGSA